MKWLNPILVFTIEEVFQTLRSNNTNNNSEFEESIFLKDFCKIDFQAQLKFNDENWKILKKLKVEINQIFEDMRNRKLIKSGLETKINIFAPKKYKEIFDNINLCDFLVCSNVILNENINNDKMTKLNSLIDIKVLIEKAEGKKCNHCWKISEGSCDRKNCAIE